MIERYKLISKISKISIILLSLGCFYALFLELISSKKSNIISNVSNITNSIRNNMEVVVNKPVFSGSGANSYIISADRISKQIEGSYYLSLISGIYNLNDKTHATISAQRAILNNLDSQISLNDDIKISYKGYTLTTNNLDLDLKSKIATNNAGINLVGEGANITANELHTSSEFNQIIFHGDVKTSFSIGAAN